jgi:hypothetical protein
MVIFINFIHHIIVINRFQKMKQIFSNFLSTLNKYTHTINFPLKFDGCHDFDSTPRWHVTGDVADPNSKFVEKSTFFGFFLGQFWRQFFSIITPRPFITMERL